MYETHCVMVCRSLLSSYPRSGPRAVVEVLRSVLLRGEIGMVAVCN